LKKRRARRGLGVPPIVSAEITMRCPGGDRTITIPGPTASEAIRKAQAFDPRRDKNIPRFLALRCQKIAARIVKRNPGFAGARGGTRCPPANKRVVFQPNMASFMLYDMPPSPGERGVTISIPLPGARRTCMPGPGGGLVFVKWDRRGIFGVAPYDLRRVKVN